MHPRTLVLGLGGTGGLALLKLKALFARYGGSSSGQPPPHVRLLHVDTVSNHEREGFALSDAECAGLTVGDPRGLIRNPYEAHLLDWLPAHLPVQTLLNGAAQFRPLGRLALFGQVGRFIERLGHCLDELTDRARLREAHGAGAVDDRGALEVYILSSLCGGTGSGLFLDVAHLVRQELKNAPTVRMIGVFLMQGPFRRRAATQRVSANAYAALKELDHLAALREPVEIDYGAGRKLNIDRSPFDLVYLVDSVGERFDTTVSLPQLATQMAYLPYLMSSTTLGVRVREVLENLIPQLEGRGRVMGKRAAYASFGVATLEIPRESVAAARREFGFELFDRLLADSEALDFEEFLSEIRRDVRGFTLDTLVAPTLSLLGLDLSRASLEELDHLYQIAVEDLGHFVHDAAEAALAPSFATWHERLASWRQTATTRPGLLRATRQGCSEIARRLAVLREEIPLAHPDHEAIEEARRASWARCQKAFRAFWRRHRLEAAHEWAEVVQQRVLPGLAEDRVNEVLRNKLASLRGAALDLATWCEQATNCLMDAQHQLSRQEAGKGTASTPFARYGDARQLRPAPMPERFLADLGELPVTADDAVAKLLDAVRAHADEIFAGVFTASGPGSATRLLLRDVPATLAELRRFSAPLWSFADERIPAADRAGIHHLEILGVDQLSDEVQAVLADHRGLDVVAIREQTSTGESLSQPWDQVLHLQIRAGLPLFALTSLEDLWRDYSRHRDRADFHLDQRWVGWPELLAHDFPLEAMEFLAKSWILTWLRPSATGLEWAEDSSIPPGSTFVEVLRHLARASDLQQRIQDAFHEIAPGPDEVTARRHDLWTLLSEDRLVVGDRPLVEALWLDLGEKQRWAGRVLAGVR